MKEVPTFNIWVGPWRDSEERDSVIIWASKAGGSLCAEAGDADLVVVNELKSLLSLSDSLPETALCIFASDTGDTPSLVRENWIRFGHFHEIPTLLKAIVLATKRLSAKPVQA